MRNKLISILGILLIIIYAKTLFAQYSNFKEGIKVTIPMTSGLESPSFLIDDREDILVFKHRISKLEEIAKPGQYGGAGFIVFPAFSFETKGFPELPDFGRIYSDNVFYSDNVVELIFIDNNAEVKKYFKDRNYNLELWFVNKAKEHLQEFGEFEKYVETRLSFYDKLFEKYEDTTNGQDGNSSHKPGGSDNESSPQLKDKNKKKPKDSTEEPGAGDGNSNGAIKEDSPKQTIDESETGPGFYWYILFAAVFLIIALLTIIIRRRCSDNG